MQGEAMLVNTDARRRIVVLLMALFAAAVVTAPPAPAQTGEPIPDPIPEQPIASGLGLQVEEFVQLPQSEPTPPPTDQRLVRRNRINYLGEIPDGSGRLYVPDLNGKLYLIRRGTPRVYLDVGATFAPAFFSGRGLGQGFGFAAFHPDFERNGRFYTVHTEQASQTTAQPDFTQGGTILFHGVVTEWTADDPRAGTFSGTRREVLRIAFGDGGTGVRTTEPQDMALVHGKLLRIDARGSNAANGEYGIPEDNPFAG